MNKQSLLQNEIPAELLAERERLQKLVTEHEINGLTGTVFHELLAIAEKKIKKLLAKGATPPADTEDLLTGKGSASKSVEEKDNGT